MTKSELIEAISDDMILKHKSDAEIIVNTLFDTMTQTLVNLGRIEIRGFGSFWPKKRKARAARNPRSGASVQVPQKYVVSFRAGKELRSRVDSAGQSHD